MMLVTLSIVCQLRRNHWQLIGISNLSVSFCLWVTARLFINQLNMPLSNSHVWLFLTQIIIIVFGDFFWLQKSGVITPLYSMSLLTDWQMKYVLMSMYGPLDRYVLTSWQVCTDLILMDLLTGKYGPLDRYVRTS